MAFKLSYLLFIVPTFLVFISAVLSAKQIGGSLGKGLKLIAGGSVIDTALIAVYLSLERGLRGILSDQQINLFFLFGGILGSSFLIMGYIKIYKIAKKFKLFTP